MLIHIVQPGDTILSIASSYGVAVNDLVRDNGITNPYDLVIGQTIVIVYPSEIYTVKEGDTLESIANQFNITVIQLLRNNPNLADSNTLNPGESLIINYADVKLKSITTNGFAYPFIDRNILRKTLPYLTYLSVFAYTITFEGGLVDIDDREIIRTAKQFSVVPIMIVSTVTVRGEGNFEVSHEILTNEEKKNILIMNILNVLETKGYFGVNLSLEYILPSDLQEYSDFIVAVTNAIKPLGYFVFVTITPKSVTSVEGTIYQDIDFRQIGMVTDSTLLFIYEWGYTFAPPGGNITEDVARLYLNYITTQIPSEKISIGLPVIGYDWQLPFIEGESWARSLTTTSAIELAKEKDVIIQYDETYRAPYFYYLDNIYGADVLHIVWFKDARSVKVVSDFILEYNFNGMSTWNIMNYFAQMWLILNSQYDIITINYRLSFTENELELEL
ncbi:MAG: hypothetical protein K0S41_1995 [Anaerocolumna sp.]|jgi:spore germination protein|nr:hypothetical protein [Anaerocolumna sp.]